MDWDNVIQSISSIDTKTWFAAGALIISLLSFQRSIKSDRRSRQTEAENKDLARGLRRAELHAELHEVWLLLGGDLETNTVKKPKSRADLNLAKSILQRCLLKDASYSEVHGHFGLWYWHKGFQDKAELSYRKAIELDPGHVSAHTNLGVVLGRSGQSEEAEQCFRKAIELDPDYALAHTNLGVTLENSGRPEEAEQCYRTAIELDPDSASAHKNLGVVLENSGRLEEAEQCLRKAVELDPDYALAHTNLGVVLGRSGQRSEDSIL